MAALFLKFGSACVFFPGPGNARPPSSSLDLIPHRFHNRIQAGGHEGELSARKSHMNLTTDPYWIWGLLKVDLICMFISKKGWAIGQDLSLQYQFNKSQKGHTIGPVHLFRLIGTSKYRIQISSREGMGGWAKCSIRSTIIL